MRACVRAWGLLPIFIAALLTLTCLHLNVRGGLCRRGVGGGWRVARNCIGLPLELSSSCNVNKHAVQRGGVDDGWVYGSFKHLQVIVHAFAHDNALLAINSIAVRAVEWAVAAAAGADGSNMGAITVLQHLPAMIILVSYKDVRQCCKDLRTDRCLSLGRKWCGDARRQRILALECGGSRCR